MSEEGLKLLWLVMFLVFHSWIDKRNPLSVNKEKLLFTYDVICMFFSFSDIRVQRTSYIEDFVMMQSGMLLSLTRRGMLRTPQTILSLSFARTVNFDCYSNAAKLSRIPCHLPVCCKVCFSTTASLASASQMQVKKKIKSLKSVTDLLELFEASKNSLDMINKVTVLHTIANTIWHDGYQRLELQNIRAQSPHGHSMFKKLLNNIADNLMTENLHSHYLGKIVWSLEKIQETNHRLYQICTDEMRGKRENIG